MEILSKHSQRNLIILFEAVSIVFPTFESKVSSMCRSVHISHQLSL